MNAGLELKSMQIIDKESFEKWIPLEKSMSRYETNGSLFVIKNRFPDRCARLWFNPVITWDGKVIPCCFDKDAEYIMGDMIVESFREIWNGQKFRDFRKGVMKNRQGIEICRNCTSGLQT
jgi:radical SAM protein with 4Fe4S-binding SPASM domain